MKSHTRTPHREPRSVRRPLALAVALALGMPLGAHAAAPVADNALPTNPHNITGRISIPDAPRLTTDPQTNVVTSTLSITQQSRGAVVDWDSFNIGKNAVVEIRNPTWNRQSVTLNRVTGPDPSQIFGRLTADGSVFLTNPQGVTFAPGSSVNVGGLVASTLAYAGTAADFVSAVDRGASSFSFVRQDGAPLGVVVAQAGSNGVPPAGIVADGGTVALLGDYVVNGGSLRADRGTVAFGSGEKVTLDFQGDGLTMLTIDLPNAIAGLVGNLGTIQADGGQVVMRLDSQQAGAAILGGGVIRARSLRNSGGRIILSAAPGGRYGGNGPTGVGGTTEVTGKLDAGAAQTGTAGGAISLAGDRLAISGANVSIDAHGNGGANGTLDLASSASVLVSGADTLRLQSADAELAGYSLILDSALSGALDHGTDVALRSLGRPSSGVFSGQYDGSVWMTSGEDSGEVDAEGDAVYYPSAQIGKTAGGDARLLIQANRDIYMMPGSSIGSTSGALAVDLDADHAGKDGAQLYGSHTESGGQISLLGAAIASNGGSVRLFGQGDPNNGRATGSVTYLPGTDPGNFDQDAHVHGDGIRVLGSLIDACVRLAGGACTGSGAVNLRGQGIDEPGTDGDLYTALGVDIASSHLYGGSGGIALDGIGSTAGSGVIVSRGSLRYLGDVQPDFPLAYNPGYGGPSIVQATGSILIDGTVGSMDAPGGGTPAPVPDSVGSGVGIGDGSQVLAGGNLTIRGHGGDVSPALPEVDEGDFLAASNGIVLVGAELRAGKGKRLALTGWAGSPGTSGDPDDLALVTPAALRIDWLPAGTSTPAVPTSLSAPGGAIQLTGHGDVYVEHTSIDAASASGKGGSIGVDGDNILLGGGSRLDASGSGDGGSVRVNAGAVAAMDGTAAVLANAGSGGRGGNILLYGGGGLRAYGSLAARGDRGTIETSGAFVDLRGIRVDARAGQGRAGTWLIDPYDVSIVAGNGTGSLDSNPFVPPADSSIQDGDINQALNNGTSVTITTGDPDAGTAYGRISIGYGVLIDRTQGTAPLDLKLQAHGAIDGNNFTIRSSAGALNMDFDSDADGLQNPGAGGIRLGSAILRSNGGDIRMFGQHDAAAGYSSSIMLTGSGSLLDTRTGGSDTAAAGNVLLRAQGQGYQALDVTGVMLQGGYTPAGLVITTGRGNIDVVGRGSNGGDGIAISTDNVGGVQLLTSSGHIHLTGFGSLGDPAFLATAPGSGISSTIGPYGGSIVLQTGGGEIDLRGRGPADSDDGNGTALGHDGLKLGAGTRLSSNGGTILLGGSSDGSGAGIDLVGGQSVGVTPAYSLIDAGSGRIVLRAHNDPAALRNPLRIGGGLAIRSSGVVNIRPGSVDGNGNLVENPGDAITIGAASGYAGGINLTTGNLAQIDAGTLVLGSDRQAGDVTVSGDAGNIAYGGNLTLHAGGGGEVRLDGGTVDVGAHTLALLAGGAVSQAGAIVAGALLAVSDHAGVLLANAANQVAAHTVAGRAADAFTFYNSGDLGIGTVGATGFATGSGAPLALSASGIVAGGDVVLRSVGGNLLLGGDVRGAAVDLVAGPGGLFLNPLGSAIQATDRWHVWASSWIGEDRGGMAGNGNLPNLYGCTYGSTCAVTPSATANQFIYAQRPTATVNLASGTREYGLPNAAFTYTVDGMILGDLAANAIAGTPSTSATQASHVGSYAIGGSFLSPAGYLVQVNPGTLAITPATLTYQANPYSRVYGDPNGVLGGSVTGFRNGDTVASATTGTLAFGTDATRGSNVGSYAITGGGLGASDYVFTQAGGNATALSITPATLTYVADPYRRMVGVPNGVFGGQVTGFRNGDTLASSTTGTATFQSAAGTQSPVGSYAIYGGGLSANNYVFTQASGNAVALTITPPPSTYSLDFQRDTPVTYVYDRNFGIVGLCPATDLASASRDKDGDMLAREWSRVRSRPNLANCVSTRQNNSCGNF